MPVNSVKKSLFIFLSVAFIEGGIVMVAELLSGKMLAPVYGTSITVWASILGVAIASLSVGYFAGSYFSSLKISFIFILYLILFSILYIIYLPQISSLMFILAGEKIIPVTISSLIIIFPPVFAAGASTPLIIQEIAQISVRKAGNAAGLTYGISTCGGIIFTFITGFYLLPEMGITKSALITGFTAGVIPFLLLLKLKKYFYFLVFFILFGIAGVNHVLQQPSSLKEFKVLHHSEGLSGQLIVADRTMETGLPAERILYVNRIGQTWIDINSGRSKWSYPDYITVMASSLKPEPKVLLLGLGGGTVAGYLQQHLNANIDAVELDERIASVASGYFSLNPSVNIIIDDARHYIKTANQDYDLIIIDVFKAEVPPSHLLNLEAFTELKRILKQDGLIMINFNGFITGEAGKPARSIFNTIQAAGYYAIAIPTHEVENNRNILFVASKAPLKLNETRLNLDIHNSRVNFNEIALNKGEMKFDDAYILVDDKPLLEVINSEAAHVWRGNYYKYHTFYFSKKGIPFFK